MAGWYSKKMKKTQETSEEDNFKAEDKQGPSVTLLDLIKTSLGDSFDGSSNELEELTKLLYQQRDSPSSLLLAKVEEGDVNEEKKDDDDDAKSPPNATYESNNSSIPAGRRRNEKAEAMIETLIDRHVMFSHFDGAVAISFKDRPFHLSYDDIVREVNAKNHANTYFHEDNGPVLIYPSLPGPGSRMDNEAAEVAAIQKQRYEVEEVVKIWYRQIHQPEKRRLPEFTNDEAWLGLLRHWTTRFDSSPICGCMITPAIAPDHHYKYVHLKKLQWNNGGRHKNLIRYISELKEWPEFFYDFQDELIRIADEKEGNNKRSYYGNRCGDSWNWNSSSRWN